MITGKKKKIWLDSQSHTVFGGDKGDLTGAKKMKIAIRSCFTEVEVHFKVNEEPQQHVSQQ